MVIILIIFIAFVIGAVFLVVKTMKKLNSEDKGIATDTSNITSSQDFLPFVDITDDVIDLGGFNYRAIIECTSTNYALKTSAEKNVIEQSFKKFLNSLQFPISMFIQTKEINYGHILESLKDDINNTAIDFPDLKEYAEIYYQEIKHLKKTMQSSKQKKKYIIVPYDDAIKMDELNNEEKVQHSKEELVERCDILINNIAGVGITCKRLDTSALIELMYSIYHRDDDSVIENIVDGDYLNSIVSGLSKSEKEDSLKKAIIILQTAETQFKCQVINDLNPQKANDIYQAITKNIQDLKQGLTDIENKGGEINLATTEEYFNIVEAKQNEQEASQLEKDELFETKLPKNINGFEETKDDKNNNDDDDDDDDDDDNGKFTTNNIRKNIEKNN